MAGSRLLATYGLGPIFDGVGLMHAVLNYCWTISIAFTSCRRMLPDPEFYARCLRESFDELATAAAGSPREKVRAREGRA